MEERAEWHLRRQGFVPFLPRQKRTVRHARRILVRRAAFFPGYMFVALDIDLDRWRSVNGTIGVRSLIMRGQRPVPCPIGMVEQLIAITDTEGLLDFSSVLAAGSPVRILSGPFADLVGLFEKLDSANRARVLLKIMSGEVAVSMDVKDLVAA
ncbi:transcription termination/antitermination NusG family protein [Mesorhizobium sp. KR9-304]|uniref:transcription termination/antitermination protein NusG n=1 Tax=Mesorhizobium sp. KR9-304 TaxID=3156614 RepID=UPI0032B53B0C